MTAFLRTWSGPVAQWDCDEVGHLNMRYYMAYIQQARQMFMMEMGLKEAFQKNASSTVRVRDFHIRYQKEAHAGASLYIETGIVDFDAHSLRLVHMMHHRSGEIAATVTETLDHIYLRTGQSFNWPRRVSGDWVDNQVQLPGAAQPRGLKSDTPVRDTSLKVIQDMGCAHTGSAVFLPSEADIFNYINAQNFLGRAADSGGNFLAAWPEQATPAWGRVMGAILEARLHIHRGAEPGQPVHVYSGLKSFNKKVRHIFHYLLNPHTGQLYVSMESIVGLIDTEARRLADITPEIAQQLEGVVRPDLTL